jgi:peptidoglycan/xylan/chitin deacetylase (PgdA/CDA1 family)
MTVPGLPGRWPGGARSVAVVTVNLQADRAVLGPHPEYAGLDKTLSSARYGLRHGVDALLDRLDRAGVPSTWFVPGTVVAEHPQVVCRVRDAGAPVGLQGWDVVPLHDADPDALVALLDRALVEFERARVTADGFRLPCGEWPLDMADALLARGIAWSSSFVSGELPFRIPGTIGELVELPFHWTTNDRQAFDWNFAPAMPAGHARIAAYDDVLDNWLTEFHATHDEGGMWVLTLHPEIMGTPGRLVVLDELLRELRGQSGCRLMTGPELARWWADSHPHDPPGQPLSVFLGATGRTHL